MTTAVFFDLDGTLVTFRKPYEEILAETLEDRLGRSSENLVETAQNVFLRAFEELEPDPGLRAMEAVAEEFDGEAGAPGLVASLLEHELSATRVPDGARALLERFADERPVGVISNGEPDWQGTKLEYHDLDPLVDVVVTSYEVGVHKPDPAIFRAGKEAVEADDYVMIGDDYEADIEGARAAGFSTVHLDRTVAEGVSVSELSALEEFLGTLSAGRTR